MCAGGQGTGVIQGMGHMPRNVSGLPKLEKGKKKISPKNFQPDFVPSGLQNYKGRDLGCFKPLNVC